MKASTVALRKLITDGVSVKATPRLTVEWEHNRFSALDDTFGPNDSGVDVSPAQAGDDEWLSIYDLDSIALPNRPGTGAAKARFDGTNTATMQSGHRDRVDEARFYLAGDDDQYRYFSSIQKTTSTPLGGGYGFSQPIVLTLKYKDPVKANKLVIGFDTSYARPQDFKVEVTVNGTTWINVNSYPSLSTAGRMTIWRNAETGTWQSTPAYADPTLESSPSLKAATFRGIRLTVNSMDKQNAHLDVIQMGLRLESDLTPYVESYDRSFEISDRSFIAPLGRASSNTASVMLNNMDGFFNNDNEASLYYGLIGKKAKFTMDLVYDATQFGGSDDEPIREFTMHVDAWGDDGQVTSSVSLKDSSMFLQEIEVPKVFWDNMSIGAVVWQMMDVTGFSNYAYTRSELDNGQIIPYFWPNEGDTMWDMIGSLAEGTQTAVYFDEYDIMQIKTRRSAFDKQSAIDWNLDATPNGTKLADIVSMSSENDDVVNRVNINYRPAKYSQPTATGFPKMEVVWEPESDTLTLRASSLVKDFLSTHTELWIRPDQVAYWPYESLINIRGEVLRYKGKEYLYNKASGGTAYAILYGDEDKQRIDKEQSNPNLVYANKFTGKLIVSRDDNNVLERGLFGSGVASHVLKPSSYSGLITDLRGFSSPWMGGYKPGNGVLTLTNNPNASINHYYLMRHENFINPNTTSLGYTTTFGTRLKFGAGNHQFAGMFFDANNTETGYYLTVATTAAVDREDRAWRHEISLHGVQTNTSKDHRIPVVGGDGKGVRAAIVTGRWYTVDIVLFKSANGSTERVNVYLDGEGIGSWIVDPALRPVPEEHRFGVFIRGQSNVQFEYIYAVGTPQGTSPDQTTFWDLVHGGFTSGYIERTWKYGTFTASMVKNGHPYTQTISRSSYAYDEFGPLVHEMREIEAKFDDGYVPVQHSNVYLSNSSQAAVLEYVHTPFGAKMMLANTARQNAILNGEDTLTLGADNPINHRMFIYGRALYQDDDISLVKEDTASIRRNGVTSLTFDNKFIQSEQAAEELGDWVLEMWKEGSEEINVEVFGNPLIQVGDLVTVSDPVKDMTPSTHKYFVVSVQNNFGQGLETNLTLRRARI